MPEPAGSAVRIGKRHAMLFMYSLFSHSPRHLNCLVKLCDQGLSIIQVSDNGTGVPSSCRGLMAAKHATSKLRTFSDLYGNTSDGNCEQGNVNACANDAEFNTQSTSSVSTLGFRGEALFSLANISKSMVVSTRTSEENAGEEFSFDPQGNLIPETRRTVARGVGTTVTVNGLFERLPVRRVDLCKRIKTQRMKLIKVLQGCELADELRCTAFFFILIIQFTSLFSWWSRCDSLPKNSIYPH